MLHGNLLFFCRFLIGREKPGTQSEVARLISETLEQERCLYEQHYVHDDTEQVKRHTHAYILKYTITSASGLNAFWIKFKQKKKKKIKQASWLKEKIQNLIYDLYQSVQL